MKSLFIIFIAKMRSEALPSSFFSATTRTKENDFGEEGVGQERCAELYLAKGTTADELDINKVHARHFATRASEMFTLCGGEGHLKLLLLLLRHALASFVNLLLPNSSW